MVDADGNGLARFHVDLLERAELFEDAYAVAVVASGGVGEGAAEGIDDGGVGLAVLLFDE